MRTVTGQPLQYCVGALMLALAASACASTPDEPEPPASPEPTETRVSPEPTTPEPADPVAEVQRSVVSVATEGSASSGLVVADGSILTSNEALATAVGSEVTVTFGDGEPLQATVAGGDPRTHLALIQVDIASDRTPVTFADSDLLEVGDEVQVLSTSVSGGTATPAGTATPGVVGTSSIVDGNSAFEVQSETDPGPTALVVDSQGEVAGLVTATSMTGDGDFRSVLAMPSNVVARVSDQLVAGEQVIHPYLGTSVEDGADGGAVVREIAAGSPAEQADLRAGDVIIEMGGHPVGNAAELVATVQANEVGARLPVTYTRDGSQHEVTVTLLRAPTG